MSKRTKAIIITAVLAILAAGITITAVWWNRKQKEEELVITAMYIPYGEGEYIFIDTKNNSPFFAGLPENDLYDDDGKVMKRNHLVRGNVFKIYGDGIMMQSYPGQYPGITKMVLYEEGDPEDADIYDDLVAQFYQKPDPSQIPELNIEYTQTMANVSSAITRGSYEWTYEKEDGQNESEAADSAGSVLEWKEIIDLTLTSPADLKLLFYHEKPEDITVTRWTKEERDAYRENSDTEMPEGREIETEEKDGGFYIPNAEGGYVYSIKAEWENGYAEFGFETIIK